MKIFVLGGTGFLGYYSVVEFLRRGHEVSTFSLPDIQLGNWFPKEVKVEFGDVFKMNDAEIEAIFTGYDVLIYALGPDDRVISKAPAYDFFHKFLVEECGRIVGIARNAGIKKCVVLSSYFCYFDRKWPQLHLAEHHAYIRCRNEQAARVIEEGGYSMSVCLLELPYIFGVMPETTRIPLWKDIFFDMFRKMNPVMFTKGGTSVIAVEHVGEAIVGAAENGEHGKRYPVGDVNMTWKELIRIVLDAMGQPKKRIVTVPTFLAALYGKKMRADDAKQGKEAGLDHYRLFADIQSQFFYLDVETVVEALGYQRGGVKEAIIKTVKACYPELTKTIPIIAIPKLS